MLISDYQGLLGLFLDTPALMRLSTIETKCLIASYGMKDQPTAPFCR